LFLDEIGDMPLALQTRVLRVLEDRQVVPIGGEPESVNVRIISATHRNLLGRVEDGSFREDLYYRLNGLEVALPALRDRTDKSQLLDFLLAEEVGGESVLIDASARQALLGYAWPGNVRQLRNVLRTLAALCEDGRIGLEDLPAMIRQARPLQAVPVEAQSDHPLDDAERLALLNVLEQTRWHMTHTAEQLGVSRNTLYRKLRKHGIAR
jgi:transcriptional regulator of acetoin/glycerol metabolism